MKKFIVKARRIAWHEVEVEAADEAAAEEKFMKQWTEDPDYCSSTEVDDELDRIDIEEVDDRHALSNKLITNALKRGDIPRPQIDWQCDKGICEHSDRIEGRCQCYNEEELR